MLFMVTTQEHLDDKYGWFDGVVPNANVAKGVSLLHGQLMVFILLLNQNITYIDVKNCQTIISLIILFEQCNVSCWIVSICPEIFHSVPDEQYQVSPTQHSGFFKVSLAHSAMNYWAWASGVCSVCFISDSPSSLVFVCCDTWQNGYATTVAQSFILIFMEVLSTSQLKGQGIKRKIKSEHSSGWIYAMSNTGCNSHSIQVLPLLCP